jgi:hypothetical protein
MKFSYLFFLLSEPGATDPHLSSTKSTCRLASMRCDRRGYAIPGLDSTLSFPFFLHFVILSRNYLGRNHTHQATEYFTTRTWTGPVFPFLPYFVLLSHQKTWTKSQPSKPNYPLPDATSNNNWTRNIYFLFPSSHFVTLSFFLSLLSFCQISNNLFSFSFSRPFLSTIGCPCSQGVRAKERPPTTHITYFFLSCPKLTPYHCI